MIEKIKPRTIEEYIESAPDIAQKRLREMLACLRKAAPKAEESLKWGSPALSYKTILFIFAAHKNHISLYPTPAAVRAFANELDVYKTSSSTIQFPLDKPLPRELIHRIAEYRVRAVLEEGANWM
ncbi:iron chaperone [Cellvibrio sp. ARAG 10.3]|uniref:iron chaperone n=1 Tax=Cellvibrio sp. ARAG 10.3 TaxID=3451358 RepID=UPI003F487F6A